MWQQRPASPFQKPIVEYDEKRSILWGRYFEFAKDGSCRGLGGVTGKHQQEREKRGGREGGMLFFFFLCLLLLNSRHKTHSECIYMYFESQTLLAREEDKDEDEDEQGKKKA